MWKKESKRYKITVKLKKPFTFADELPKYLSRDLIVENFIDALTHHELDDDLEIEVNAKYSCARFGRLLGFSVA